MEKYIPQLNDAVLAEVPGQGLVQGVISKIDLSKPKPYCVSYTFKGVGFNNAPISGPASIWLPKNKLQKRAVAKAG